MLLVGTRGHWPIEREVRASATVTEAEASLAFELIVPSLGSEGGVYALALGGALPVRVRTGVLN